MQVSAGAFWSLCFCPSSTGLISVVFEDEHRPVAQTRRDLFALLRSDFSLKSNGFREMQFGAISDAAKAQLAQLNHEPIPRAPARILTAATFEEIL
ncbi:MAG: hypothetical protein M0R76_11630 [Proteobacteria bacterium]|nr:hypothetical protein [Pseudomonadota bacterium]